MINARFLIIAAVLIMTAGVVFARGGREPEKKIVRVTGTVRLVGTSLFPEIVISTLNGEWYIANEEMQKLHSLQHQTVTVEGEETVIELRFANGMSAGMRRELRNVRIVSVTR